MIKDYDHTLSIDFETFSPTDIKLGAFKYAELAEILLTAYSKDVGSVFCIDNTSNVADGHLHPEPDWDKLQEQSGVPILAERREKIMQMRKSFPLKFLQALTDPKYLKKAYNVQFERIIIYQCLGIYSPPEQWEDTMVKAAMAGLPLSLAGSSEALGLVQKKDWAGAALIRYFCVPCKPTKVNGMRERNLPSHDSAKWQQFIRYCKQDVVTEQAVDKALEWLEVSETERKIWILDAKANERGVRVDLDLVRNAIDLDIECREKLIARAVEITGLSNPNSVAQIKKWLAEETGEEEIKSLSKGKIPALIKKAKSETAKEVLEIRSLLGRSSIKKYQTMLNCAGADGRIRGMFQYYGANRTGRDAGRLAQPQNYPRIYIDDNLLEHARNWVLEKDVDSLEMIFESLPDILAQLTRTAFIPAEGNKFHVSDFSAIEAITIAWLSGEEWVLQVFRTHGKIYEATASQMFRVPIESITKESDLRQKGKVAALALSYQGSVGALTAMGALEMGIPEKDLKPIVAAWREANPKIVQFWWDLEKGARDCIRTKGKIRVNKYISYSMKEGNLLMYLPSGRFLCYQKAHVAEVYMYEGKVLGYKGKSIFFMKFTLSPSQLLTIWAKGDKEFNAGEQGVIPVDVVKEINKIEVREPILFWGQNQMTKKWEVTATYAGRLSENANQATARDVLMNGFINLSEEGYHTIMRVHDETVNDNSFGSLDEVNTLMVKPAPWMHGMPLKAAGFTGKFYKK